MPEDNIFSTYILKNDNNETLAEFESNITPELLQEYLKENHSRFCMESFKKFLNKFQRVIQKFSVL